MLIVGPIDAISLPNIVYYYCSGCCSGESSVITGSARTNFQHGQSSLSASQFKNERSRVNSLRWYLAMCLLIAAPVEAFNRLAADTFRQNLRQYFGCAPCDAVRIAAQSFPCLPRHGAIRPETVSSQTQHRGLQSVARSRVVLRIASKSCQCLPCLNSCALGSVIDTRSQRVELFQRLT